MKELEVGRHHIKTELMALICSLTVLGMENGRILLSSITTKLPPSVGFEDSRSWSRLNAVVPQFPNGWLASIAEPDYLQIALGSGFIVSALAVQAGYGPGAPYVTKLRVSYSMDGKSWTQVVNTENKASKLDFPGSTGGMLPDMIHFTPVFKAVYVRIHPMEASTVKSMRMELYGCLGDDHVTTKPAGVELSRRSVLIDEVTGYIYACLYTEDRSKSICKRSKSGSEWISLERNIMGILHQARASRRLYAVNRAFHKTVSDDNGETWFTITQKEWERQLKVSRL